MSRLQAPQDVLLSVVTVTLYRDAALSRTIESLTALRSQLSQRLEHIVVSPDTSCSAIAGVVSVFKERSGIYPAMNAGIAQANGRYIWLLNAGDECINANKIVDLLEDCVDKEEMHIICCPVLRLYGDGQQKVYFGGITNPHQGLLYRKDIFPEVGYYDERYKAISDRLHFDVIRRRGIKRYSAQVPVAVFHMDGLSSSADGWKLTRREYMQYFRANPLKLLYLYRAMRLTIKLFRAKMVTAEEQKK